MRIVIPIKPVSVQKFGREAGGWERVSTLSEPLLTKMIDNYKVLGYEVDVRDVQRSESSCTSCFDAGSALGEVFGTLFVRHAAAAAREDDGLFD
ncbi:MAG: hypothetical protein Q7J84_16775 [Sulfuricaulis sp.]|nr:hypothetical protein [Sulfuricaulis sp.]